MTGIETAQVERGLPLLLHSQPFPPQALPCVRRAFGQWFGERRRRGAATRSGPAPPAGRIAPAAAGFIAGRLLAGGAGGAGEPGAAAPPENAGYCASAGKPASRGRASAIRCAAVFAACRGREARTGGSPRRYARRRLVADRGDVVGPPAAPGVESPGAAAGRGAGGSGAFSRHPAHAAYIAHTGGFGEASFRRGRECWGSDGPGAGSADFERGGGGSAIR